MQTSVYGSLTGLWAGVSGLCKQWSSLKWRSYEGGGGGGCGGGGCRGTQVKDKSDQ